MFFDKLCSIDECRVFVPIGIHSIFWPYIINFVINRDKNAPAEPIARVGVYNIIIQLPKRTFYRVFTSIGKKI